MMAMETAGPPEVSVPAKALAINGETPTEGDAVSFTVEGTVTRIGEGNVYVQPTSVNGEPIESEKESAMTDSDIESNLLEQAQKSDEAQFGKGAY